MWLRCQALCRCSDLRRADLLVIYLVHPMLAAVCLGFGLVVFLRQAT